MCNTTNPILENDRVIDQCPFEATGKRGLDAEYSAVGGNIDGQYAAQEPSQLGAQVSKRVSNRFGDGVVAVADYFVALLDALLDGEQDGALFRETGLIVLL